MHSQVVTSFAPNKLQMSPLRTPPQVPRFQDEVRKKQEVLAQADVNLRVLGFRVLGNVFNLCGCSLLLWASVICPQARNKQYVRNIVR